MSCVDYWDSYWIIQGLLKSELYDIANSTLQNFMDEINTFGFIPNGGRIYCESASVCIHLGTQELTSTQTWTGRSPLSSRA